MKERQVSLVDREEDTVNRVTSLQSVKRHTRVQVAAYTVLRTDNYLAVEYTATGTVTITLPRLATVGRGFELQFKDTSNNASTFNITIVGSGGELIDGGVLTISANRGAARIISGVTQWEVL